MIPTALFRALACVLASTLVACASAPDAASPSGANETEGAAELPHLPARDGLHLLEYQIEIEAPPEVVWERMLSPEGYAEWTKPFGPSTTFEGSWQEGERMRFLNPGNSGMVAVIAASRPANLLVIQHVGMVVNGVEDTTSEGIRAWAPAHENYHLRPTATGTLLSVQHECLDGFEGYMDVVWPRSLEALKTLCEGS